ncbi:MAG: ribonuclease III [Ruminococcaceae bacterium]|nr:ribonuclease III [Oscillospiraceae bacterium]
MEENLTLPFGGTNPNELGILQLAYVGDAVMELYARREVLSQGNYPSGKLVKMSKAFVTCEAQSDAVERILPYLSEKEEAVYKRGRNAKTHFSPSHGELIQYRRATGLEALFGYLYLSGQNDRADELFSLAYRGVAKEMAEKIK